MKIPRQAVAIELLCGLVGVFGIGNIYCGRSDTGLIGMFGFWIVAAITGCVVGFADGSSLQFYVGVAVEWVVFAVLMCRWAAVAAREFNARLERPGSGA